MSRVVSVLSDIIPARPVCRLTLDVSVRMLDIKKTAHSSLMLSEPSEASQRDAHAHSLVNHNKSVIRHTRIYTHTHEHCPLAMANTRKYFAPHSSFAPVVYSILVFSELELTRVYPQLFSLFNLKVLVAVLIARVLGGTFGTRPVFGEFILLRVFGHQTVFGCLGATFSFNFQHTMGD